MKSNYNHFNFAPATNYRNSGIMPFLAFRPAFSLQLIAPEHKLGIFFSAVHYNSYRLVKDYLHYPKYQPDHINSLIKEILHSIHNSTLHHDILICYVNEKVKVKGPNNKTASTDIFLNFFYQHMLGLSFSHSNNTRSAPIFFYIGDNSLVKLKDLSSSLGINFIDHIKQLALVLRPFVHELIGNQSIKKQKNYSNSDFLFWENKKVESNNVDTENKNDIRLMSKL